MVQSSKTVQLKTNQQTQGTKPSVSSNWPSVVDTKVPAKARLQETASDTTASSKLETRRTAVRERLRVHVKLRSTALLSRCRRPLAGIDQLRVLHILVVAGLFQDCSIDCSIRTGPAACCYCAPDSVHCQPRSMIQLQTRSQHCASHSRVLGFHCFTISNQSSKAQRHVQRGPTLLLENTRQLSSPWDRSHPGCQIADERVSNTGLAVQRSMFGCERDPPQTQSSSGASPDLSGWPVRFDAFSVRPQNSLLTKRGPLAFVSHLTNRPPTESSTPHQYCRPEWGPRTSWAAIWAVLDCSPHRRALPSSRTALARGRSYRRQPERGLNRFERRLASALSIRVSTLTEESAVNACSGRPPELRGPLEPGSTVPNREWNSPNFLAVCVLVLRHFGRTTTANATHFSLAATRRDKCAIRQARWQHRQVSSGNFLHSGPTFCRLLHEGRQSCLPVAQTLLLLVQLRLGLDKSLLRLTDFGLARNDPLPGPFDEIFRRIDTGPSLSSVPLVNARKWGPSRPLLPLRPPISPLEPWRRTQPPLEAVHGDWPLAVG